MSQFGFDMAAAPPTRRRLWPVVAALFAIGLLVLILAARQFAPPADFAGGGSGEVEVRIEEGSTLTRIGQALVDAGVVASLDAWLAAVAGDERATSIAAGRYQLKSEMSAQSALAAMLDPESRLVNRLVIREGLRLVQIIELASEATGIPADEFVAALKKPKLIGLPKEAAGKPEGFLFPATYELPDDPTATSVLKLMTARWKQMAAEENLAKRAADRGRSVMEIMIIASIVEAEVGTDDFAKAARVIENRLALPMMLQMDSTVNYALGIFELQLSSEQMNAESAYNTYKVQGLPPGPINSPGLAAIEAALSPAAGKWLYFVTVDPATKRTKFAVTYEDFLVLKQEFQENVG